MVNAVQCAGAVPDFITDTIRLCVRKTSDPVKKNPDTLDRIFRFFWSYTFEGIPECQASHQK